MSYYGNGVCELTVADSEHASHSVVEQGGVRTGRDRAPRDRKRDQGYARAEYQYQFGSLRMPTGRPRNALEKLAQKRALPVAELALTFTRASLKRPPGHDPNCSSLWVVAPPQNW